MHADLGLVTNLPHRKSGAICVNFFPTSHYFVLMIMIRRRKKRGRGRERERESGGGTNGKVYTTEMERDI